MDLVILGLLLIKSCTIYEMRKRISIFFSSVSSSSMGSIQTAIKKLLKNDMITCDEQIDNNVIKKIYSITDVGKSYMMSSLEIPMKFKEKNMELSKLFFMGFVPQEKWIELIDGYLTALMEEKENLMMIEKKVQEAPGYEAFLESNDNALFEQLEDKQSKVAKLNNIVYFQNAMLELSIQKVELELEWFRQLKTNLNNGDMKHD